MAKITIRLPYPDKVGRYSTNKYYTGKNPGERAADARFWHDLLMVEAPWDRGPLRSPVRLEFYWNDRMDLSNHSMMAKMIEDGIKGRIIEDDSRKHVQEITHRFYNEKVITIVVEEMEDG